MTDKELAYELFGRYNGDEIMYRHNKCYLELAHHLLQEDKDCDLYPHVAFAMANELYKDAGDTFNESYMQAAVEGFEKLQNPSDDVKAKLAKAKDVIARAQQSRQLYMENMSHRVLDKRVESMIEGAEYLLKCTPLIKEEGVYIHDIFIHNDDDYDLLSIDVIIDIEESDSDKVHHLKLHVEDIDKFEFERENFGLFVFDFTVMPYEYEHKFCPIQKSCLIEASFDEVGFITAATVTVEELTDEQLRTQTAR